MLNHIPAGTHMCLIYSSQNEVTQDIADFLAQSIQDDGIAHYFYAAEEPDAVIHQLCDCACAPHDVHARLVVHSAASVYAPDGRFDKDRTLQMLKDTFAADRQSNPGSVHYTGEMDWALNLDIESNDQLIAYEQAVNKVCKSHPFSAICQYDASKFDPAFLLQVMQAHPFLLVDGMITPSPFYLDTH